MEKKVAKKLTDLPDPVRIMSWKWQWKSDREAETK